MSESMSIERAKELTSGCVKTSMSALGLNAAPVYVPLPEASLEELLEANRLMAQHREPSENGGQRIYSTVADRGIALFYAYEHFGRSPETLLKVLGYEISDDED